MPLTYRPRDLADLISPPRSAAEQCAGTDYAKPVDHAAIFADCCAAIIWGNPGLTPADADTITEAAKTLASYRLSSALIDGETPTRVRVLLRNYADAILAAHAAEEAAQDERVAA